MKGTTLVATLTWALASAMAFSAGAAAQPADTPVGRLYRLDDSATYQEGCFDPCDCPISEQIIVRGAFTLGPPATGNVVDFYRVSDIYWTVGDPLEPVHTLTGSGTYRLTNYGPPQSHSLDLMLSLDGAPPELFFSDFVPADGGAASLNIPVSINGMYCNDKVIVVSAAPVPRAEVARYTLTDAGAFQQGCFDPCDCLLEEPRPMQGSFDLVPLYDTGTVAGYAVARMRLQVPPLGDLRGMRFRGFGRYTLVQGFAGPADTMALLLRSGNVSTPFDSPLRNTAAQFPELSVIVDMNDRVCFDRLLTVDAVPSDVVN